jgi:hypothetical protein
MIFSRRSFQRIGPAAVRERLNAFCFLDFCLYCVCERFFERAHVGRGGGSVCECCHFLIFSGLKGLCNSRNGR